MKERDSIFAEQLNENLTNRRIARWEGDGYVLVDGSAFTIPDSVVQQTARILSNHPLKDGTSISDPILRGDDEDQQAYRQRVERILKLYGFEDMSPEIMVQYLVAKFLINSDPLGELRGEKPELGLDPQLVVVDINKVPLEDE